LKVIISLSTFLFLPFYFTSPQFQIITLSSPIGVFDSGYGGLTVLKSLVSQLPGYDFIYLGDNARSPYGTRSFETVYRYTQESVQWFFHKDCPLVILACNTASAKALRTIQQNDLPHMDPERRVLGVIRPTAEIIGTYSKSGHIGVLATPGTVASQSYPIEIGKFFPSLEVTQQACPMWVPLIENNEHLSAGADYFVNKCVGQLLEQSPSIDTILLGCTHYPLIAEKISKAAGGNIRVVSQGEIVAASLADYLERHPEIDRKLSKNGRRSFYTTDSTEDFDRHAAAFFGETVKSEAASLL
jgi:glutamate racemase